MKKTKKLSKMRGENWKDLWLQPCRAKEKLGPATRMWMRRKLHSKRFQKLLMFVRVESSLPAKHEDHIAGKGFTSMPQPMKIPDAKASVDKEWKKLDITPAWKLTKVKSKREVWKHNRKNEQSTFVTLMNIHHLKNAELEPKYQKYKGRVVLRGDIVKDDSGSYAVFTEQGSSPNDCRKSNGCYCKIT